METRSKKKKEESPHNILTSDVQINQSDTNHLLGIFPKEVWSLILENVDNLNDYYKIGAVSQIFNDVISQKRVHIFFPSVLKVLLDQCVHLERKKRAGDTEGHDNPKFTKWIDFRDLAPLRQVCRISKTTLDTLFQNTSYQYQFPIEGMTAVGQFYTPLEDHYEKPFCLTNAEKIHKFRAHFDPTHLSNDKANPFVTRKVWICPPKEGDLQGDLFYTELISFLHVYGKHIWFCYINASVDTSQQLRFYNNLKNILELVPNIKILRIVKDPYEFELPVELENQVVECYKQTSFPGLEHLELIDQGGVPMSIHMELQNATLPKLRQVGMSLYTEQDGLVLFNNTAQYAITKLRLETLFVPPNWERVFDAIKNQYGETLLELQLCFSGLDDSALNKRLRLPKLKTLYLQLDRPFPLDFLLGMSKTLEKLDLRFGSADALQLEYARFQESEIKIYRRINELHTSNIWRKFPKLQTLDIWEHLDQDTTPPWSCTRKKWEKEVAIRRAAKK